MTAGRGIDLVRHMQYFLAVAEAQHFGRAAEALGMSQPPLSQGIRRLEQALGARLFDRGAGTRLTTAGRDLIPRARLLVRTAAEIVEAPLTGPNALRLGVVPQAPATVVASFAAALRRSSDDHEVTVERHGSLELVRRVRDGRLDLGAVEHPVVPDGIVGGRTVARLRRWILVPAGHPLAARRSVQLTALRGTALAATPRADNPAAYDLLAEAAISAGLVISSVAAADDTAALLVAASGRAAALTADSSVLGADPGCVRLAVLGNPLPLRLRLIGRAHDDHFASAEDAFDRTVAREMSHV